jgi:aminomethyltransferase
VEPKKTPLYEKHVKLGGKMVPFAGFMMPVEFTGIVDEHLSVRSEVGIFDVSHMGEISVSGDGALEYVNRLVANDVSELDLCQALYATMLNDAGGIIDDMLVYRRKFDYLLVPNAANAGRVFAWMTEHAPAGLRIENQSDATGQIAVQGPRAMEVMVGISGDGFEGLKYFRSMGAQVGDVLCLVSRTGYTGEDGVEIYADAARIGEVWDVIMAQDPRPKPCGLGARDTLRLEASLRLHGSDIDETTTPLEAGLGWTVKMDKGDFYGREALVRQQEEGLARRLIGLRSQARRFPRRGCKVLTGDRPIGEVTSGGFSPTLQCGIALAYVETALARSETEFKIDVRGQLIDATYVKGPFYRRPKGK